MSPDMSSAMDALGTALGENRKIEELNMRNNKIKAGPYNNFWLDMCGNANLKRINLSKSELGDKVI